MDDVHNLRIPGMNQHRVFSAIQKATLIRKSRTEMRLEPASHGGCAMTGRMMKQVVDHFEPVFLTAPDLEDFRRTSAIQMVQIPARYLSAAVPEQYFLKFAMRLLPACIIQYSIQAA